jgi:probable addiction module antidote protein
MAKEKITFSKWDISDYLKDEEDIRTYLDIAAENNDPRKFARALGNVVRARDISRIARKVKLTRYKLSKSLSGDSNPRLETVVKVVAALGLRLTFAPAVKTPKAKTPGR